MRVDANGTAIEVEDFGPPDRPAVVLVMGLGMQLVAWPDAFVDTLVAAGYRVVRFDNRDIGLSQKFDQLGVPNLVWESVKHRLGFSVQAPYTVHDMAADTLGVMDALRIESAHVVGVSMGGMIAQRVAIAAPQRVMSLTSIMSSSGARYLPGPKAHVLQALLSRPGGKSEEAIVDHYVHLFQVIGSPGFPMDEAELRRRITVATRRSFHPQGTVRQLTAVAADAHRADELPRIKAPTLVIHGRDDPLVPLPCGNDTARRISGAKFHVVPGMGHDLVPGVVERLLASLLPHLQSVHVP
ncbi:alpha/beta fold hydrolase [Ramlibacter sp. PS4R-6]|uniref:alpha/beta fold hydrolase n=1 Tax=Ramlibacter sp. PS4R-6 TaxID=3133438 RepID=UPI00309CFAAC